MTQETEHIEAEVDARSTKCQCCGDDLESKGARSRLCSACITKGCDPAGDLCLRDRGDQ